MIAIWFGLGPEPLKIRPWEWQAYFCRFGELSDCYVGSPEPLKHEIMGLEFGRLFSCRRSQPTSSHWFWIAGAITGQLGPGLGDNLNPKQPPQPREFRQVYRIQKVHAFFFGVLNFGLFWVIVLNHFGLVWIILIHFVWTVCCFCFCIEAAASEGPTPGAWVPPSWRPR